MQGIFGSRLRECRKRLRLTQGGVAEEVRKVLGGAKISKQHVSKWEKGYIAAPSTEYLDALARVLKTTPGFLMGADDTVQRREAVNVVLSRLSAEQIDALVETLNRPDVSLNDLLCVFRQYTQADPRWRRAVRSLLET